MRNVEGRRSRVPAGDGGLQRGIDLLQPPAVSGGDSRRDQRIRCRRSRCASTGSNPPARRRARGCARAIGFTRSMAGRSRPLFRSGMRSIAESPARRSCSQSSVRGSGGARGARPTRLGFDFRPRSEQTPMTTTRLVALALLTLYPLPFLIVAGAVPCPARPRSPRVVARADVRRVHRLRAERRGTVAGHPPGAAPAAPRHVGALRTDRAWGALLFLCQLPRAHVARSPVPWLKGLLLGPPLFAGPVLAGAELVSPGLLDSRRPPCDLRHRRRSASRSRSIAWKGRPRPDIARLELVRRPAGDQAAHARDALGDGSGCALSVHPGGLHRVSAASAAVRS